MTDIMIGETLRVLRMQRGMTQEQLAAAVGISPSAVNFYEENIWRPGTEVVTKIAEALSVTIEEIVGHQCQKIFDRNGDTLYMKNINGRYVAVARTNNNPIN